MTGPPCSWGIKIRGSYPPGWGSLESETVKCGHESRGTRTREWLRWRGPAAIVNPIVSSERMLQKDYNSKCSENTINNSSPIIVWHYCCRGEVTLLRRLTMVVFAEPSPSNSFLSAVFTILTFSRHVKKIIAMQVRQFFSMCIVIMNTSGTGNSFDKEALWRLVGDV
jgi:hypothetical protein